MIGSEGFTIHWAPIKEQLMPRYTIGLFLISCKIKIFQPSPWKWLTFLFFFILSVQDHADTHLVDINRSFNISIAWMEQIRIRGMIAININWCIYLYTKTGTSNGKMDFSLFTEGISDGMRFWHVLTVLEWPVVQYDVVCLLFYYAHLRHLLFLHWDHLPYPY